MMSKQVVLRTWSLCGADLLFLVICLGAFLSAPTSQAARSLAFPLSSDWQTTSVGGAVSGSFVFNAGMATLRVTGGDIGGTKDRFFYAYHWLGNTGDMTVQLGSFGKNVNAWAKAGIMIRESSSSTSNFAMVALTPGHGAIFESRVPGSSTVNLLSSGRAFSASHWFRLSRQGRTIVSFLSLDGTHWSHFATVTLTTQSVMLVGFAVSSYIMTQTNTITYRNISVNGTVTPPTPTPTPTTQPSPTPVPYAQFKDGTYVIGKDIQPGTYRTRQALSGCYYARLSGFGNTLDDIIANNATNASAIVTISSTDKGFETSSCGTWTKDLSAITTSKISFADGMYIVGTDIQPGTYKNSGQSGCYYARLSGFGNTLDDIIANNATNASAIVTISSTDKGFESSNCGAWTKE